MSFLLQNLGWRPPLTEDWAARFEALTCRIKDAAADGIGLEAGRELAIELRRLANMRTGALEQARMMRCAARLWPLRHELPTLAPLHLLLVGNRNLGFLAAELPGAGLARGLLIRASEPPYGTLNAIALGDAPAVPGEPLDAVFVCLDSQAFIASPALLDHASEAAQLRLAESHLQRLNDGLRRRAGAPCIMATIPLPPEAAIASIDGATPGAEARFVERINELIREGAARGDWFLWDMAGLAAEVGRQAWFDPVRFHQAKAPFAVELCHLAADQLCRVLAALRGKAGRALVLDLDNTLWGGVIGDDGLEGVRIGQGSAEGEAYAAFQKFILQLRARGVALAVCSKNDDILARRALREHPDMLLRPEHFAVIRANWSDKVSNLRSIAGTLNLGPESLVFVDDNPAERAWVRRELPLVAVPEMPADPACYPRTLAASGVFEHLRLNAEDLGRAESYRAESLRVEAAQQAGSYADYLASLKMRMNIAPFDRVGRARIAQLIGKSNQFNVTTRRYNEAQIEALESSPSTLHWQVRLSDAFGDHGMIAVLIVDKGAATWSIDTWLMSCRVLERGVEQALMNLLVEEAARCGVRWLEAEYIRTERNALVETLFDRLGFTRQPDDSDAHKRYRLSLEGFAPLASAVSVAVRRT